MPTWVLGYPLSRKYAIRYANRRKLVSGLEDPDQHCLHAASRDIKWRAGLGDQRTSPLLCCWVGGEIQLVIGICVDSQSRTRREAEDNLDPAFLPPKECVLRLAYLMKAKAGPRWYRYDNSSWTPEDEDRRRAAKKAAAEQKAAADAERAAVDVDVGATARDARAEEESDTVRDGEMAAQLESCHLE